MPDTLNGKERKMIHALSTQLDIYHAGVGNNDKHAINTSSEDSINNDQVNTDNGTVALKRRIAISIYADGINHVPDYSTDEQVHSFPSQRCKPWYFIAYNNTDNVQNDTDIQSRIDTIELEKKQIRQFALPETSLRTLETDETVDSIDFSVLDNFDLSMCPDLNDTPYILVDTVEKLRQCVDELASCSELAFDMEMCNVGEGNSTKSGTRTCLIQITSNLTSTIVNEDTGSTRQVEKDYIIDPLAPGGLWEAIPKLLSPLFSNPAIVKIGHGIGGMDVSSLHRDFGILVVNAFDTYEASAIVTQKKAGLGLANLCKHYGLPNHEHYQDLKQRYQNSDWVKRPLDEEAVEYGRYDARYLCSLRRLLMRDLVKMDMIGSTLQKFGSSSLEDDSGMESNNTPVLQTLDSTMSSSTVTTSSTSISDDLNNSSDEQQESKDDILDEEKLLVVKLLASELPCYHRLMNAISISQKRCLKLWTKDGEDEQMLNPTLITIIKEAALQKGYGKDWSDDHMQLYRDLYDWRKKTAERLAISTSEVCTLDLLVHVAYRLPTSRCELRRFSFILPSILEDVDLSYCNEMFDLVMSSEVFKLQQSITRRLDVVYYSKSDSKCKSINRPSNDSDCKSSRSESEQKRWLKLLLTSSVVGLAAIVAIKSRRR